MGNVTSAAPIGDDESFDVEVTGGNKHFFTFDGVFHVRVVLMNLKLFLIVFFFFFFYINQ